MLRIVPRLSISWECWRGAVLHTIAFIPFCLTTQKLTRTLRFVSGRLKACGTWERTRLSISYSRFTRPTLPCGSETAGMQSRRLRKFQARSAHADRAAFPLVGGRFKHYSADAELELPCPA